MFPLYDENPTELTPVVTVLFMGLCAAAWIFLQGAGGDPATYIQSICTYGLIPAELTGSGAPGTTVPLGPDATCTLGGLTWGAAVTSMFMHGGWGHFLGNMWFLWVFGNNVEDSMGHLRYAVFYIVCGLAAAGAQVLSDPGSAVPMVGASGAISGIMGAYAVLYPKVRVNTLIFLIIYIRVLPLPAYVMLGYWFLIQLLSGASGLEAGTAFWAHIGGFVAGVVLIKLFERPQLVEAKREKRKLSPQALKALRW